MTILHHVLNSVSGESTSPDHKQYLSMGDEIMNRRTMTSKNYNRLKTEVPRKSEQEQKTKSGRSDDDVMQRQRGREL